VFPGTQYNFLTNEIKKNTHTAYNTSPHEGPESSYSKNELICISNQTQTTRFSFVTTVTDPVGLLRVVVGQLGVISGDA